MKKWKRTKGSNFNQSYLIQLSEQHGIEMSLNEIILDFVDNLQTQNIPTLVEVFKKPNGNVNKIRIEIGNER